eukprot:11179065-Lingulodinium_polyedra.AAC.1
MTGNQQKVAKPKSLFSSDRKPNEVIDVRGPLCGLDDRVVSDCPEEHAGGVAHDNAPQELAE